MRLEITTTFHDDPSVREKLKVMNAWDALWDDYRTKCEVDWEDEASATLKPGKRYKIVLTIDEVPIITCPWCGYAEIERPQIEVSTGLCECPECGAEEIDPAEVDSEPDHRMGWRRGSELYDAEKHGPLKRTIFPIKNGNIWEARTEAGKLVQLPEDHEMVDIWKHNHELNQSLEGRTWE